MKKDPKPLEELYQSKEDPYGIKSSQAHARRMNEIGAFLDEDAPFLRALDVGCGEGCVTAHLAMYVDTMTVGIDVSGTAIKRAVHSYDQDSEFVEGDFIEYKPRRKFDLVIATGVVDCFLGRIDKFTDAVGRCLKKRGGRLLVSHVKSTSDGDGYLKRLCASGFKAVRSAEFMCGGSVHSIHLLKQA